MKTKFISQILLLAIMATLILTGCVASVASVYKITTYSGWSTEEFYCYEYAEENGQITINGEWWQRGHGLSSTPVIGEGVLHITGNYSIARVETSIIPEKEGD